MIRSILSNSLILFAMTMACAVQGQDQVQWKSMNEALELAVELDRKIFVDMYTPWCSWCRKMDKTTFQKPDIAAYINANFIPVKFNAEDREDITYQGTTFKFVKYGDKGYHQLAAELCKNLGSRLSYPTIIFLDEKQNVIQPIPGFQDPKSFEVIMYYIGENHFKKKPYKSYAASFRGNYN